MKKSVYSIVLSDDVIKAIDKLAYQTNTSRSNLINQILAEHVSYMTPEKRMKNIFDCMRQIMDNSFQIQLQNSDSIMSLKSSLRYKYKPTVRYKVEILKEPKENIFSIFSASTRTQSTALIEAFAIFFQLWQQLEQKYIGSCFPEGIKSEFTGSKYVRGFQLPAASSNATTDSAAKAISYYITLFDSVMKIYFEGIDTPEATAFKMESFYSKAIKNSLMII
jgi:hypothetical protein